MTKQTQTAGSRPRTKKVHRVSGSNAWAERSHCYARLRSIARHPKWKGKGTHQMETLTNSLSPSLSLKPPTIMEADRRVLKDYLLLVRTPVHIHGHWKEVRITEATPQARLGPPVERLELKKNTNFSLSGTNCFFCSLFY